MRAVILMSLFFATLLTYTLRLHAESASNSNAAKTSSSAESLPSTHKDKFIDLFRNDFKSDHLASGVEKRFSAAADYIERCCKHPDDIINLLKSNGFKVKTYNERPSEVTVKGRVIEYDEIIGGTRSPGLQRFWQITTTYRADIYLKNNKVVFVSAVVDTALP